MSPVSIKKTLYQQLKTFCIQKDEDARAQEVIGNKGSQILWKLYLQQWSLPVKKQDFFAFIPSQNDIVWVSQAQKEKEEVMLSGHRRVSLCNYIHMS